MAFLAEAKARKGFKRVFDIDSQEPEIKHILSYRVLKIT